MVSKNNIGAPKMLNTFGAFKMQHNFRANKVMFSPILR